MNVRAVNLIIGVLVVVLIVVLMYLGFSARGSEKYIDEGDYKVMLFHAPWCGYCKKTVPIFKALQAKYKDSKLGLVTVNGDLNKDLTKKYGVNAYPTIKLLKGGKFVADYEGDRSMQSLEKWISKYV